jgi:hypothetical protein
VCVCSCAVLSRHRSQSSQVSRVSAFIFVRLACTSVTHIENKTRTQLQDIKLAAHSMNQSMRQTPPPSPNRSFVFLLTEQKKMRKILAHADNVCARPCALHVQPRRINQPRRRDGETALVERGRTARWFVCLAAQQSHQRRRGARQQCSSRLVKCDHQATCATQRSCTVRIQTH